VSDIEKYQKFKLSNIKLNMSRGRPCSEQLDLSNPMISILGDYKELIKGSRVDYRNYGILDGVSGMKNLFAEILEVHPNEVFVGGNSSLSMMFDTISYFMLHGAPGHRPWISEKDGIRFLCPCPGYDRHFAMLSHFDIIQIPVQMLDTGPDMDAVERLVRLDESVKGIFCVPKYSNPTGITYSDETVRRLANLAPSAKDFKIFWDNAYAVHNLTDKPDKLLNLMDECKKVGTQDMPIMFTSTSKITFPGSGVAALAASENNLKALKKNYSYKTIGFNKLSQLRHYRFLKSYENILAHMKKHAEILKPKFDAVLNILEREFPNKQFSEYDSISWSKPNGGYFVSVNVPEGCAKRVVSLCKGAGLQLTSAGAAFPNGFDPHDRNIRIAPSNPSVDELNMAMELFCLCVRMAYKEKIKS
jgi:DNA-binding transcriptional MocR family regulator